MALPTVEAVTDPAAGYLTAVPRVGPGVCEICHGAPNADFLSCFSCARTFSQVSYPLRTVVPISLYEVPGQLHHVLRGYKDSPSSQVRDKFSLLVAALLTRFMRRHGDCLIASAGAGWDVITAVPSGRARIAPDPVVSSIHLSRELRSQYVSSLVRGPGPLAHRQASDKAFTVIQDLRGKRVLLVDDTFTTGAAMQSAASSLSTSGAHVVAGIVVGRVIDPGFNLETAALWSQAVGRPFDFERCCLCSSGATA